MQNNNISFNTAITEFQNISQNILSSFLKNYLLQQLTWTPPPIPFFPYIFVIRFDYIWSISSTLFPLILN